MREITVSAKTVDDAITEALIQLGITSDMLEYEVIEKGSSGFLGIGMKQAVIKASKKEITSEKAEKKEPQPTISTERTEPTQPTEPTESIKPAAKEKNMIRPEVELAQVEEGTIKACETFLYDVLKAMNMEVKITSIVDEDGALCIDMQGDNMGILIGKRGQTLDSLQYLTNRIANKSQEGYVRIKLDTEDYRRRRKETLENLAKNIAFKVKRTKRTVSLEPMNPYERRIIHSALQADKGVTTHSEGEEPYRRVVVTLARR